MEEKRTESKNTNLHKAKSAKNDEFYTLYESIQEELNHYTKHFEGKTVLCNCDDPYESNFCLFFLKNFNFLKLKRLICTSYKGSPVVATQIRLFDDELDEPMTKECAYVLDVKEIPMENGRGISDADIQRLLHKKRNGKVVRKLKGDGDFQSKECLKLLKEADIVVTNPPFSKFRDFVAVLNEYNKKFIIWGNNNAITYKEIFPLIKENKMWLGYCANKTCIFQIPKHYTKWDEKETKKRNDGNKYCKVPAISVFTNLDIPKRHEELILYKQYNAEEYPTYDNYDAINVDKVTNIPKDYCESWGLTDDELDCLPQNEWEVVRMEEKDGMKLNYVIPSLGTKFRELMHNQVEGYKEEIETYLVNILYIENKIPNCSGVLDEDTSTQSPNKVCPRQRLQKKGCCNGILGVPITFLDKWNPGQYEIIGLDRYVKDNPKYGHRFRINDKETYARILITKIL